MVEIRKLELSDYYLDYLQLLNSLSPTVEDKGLLSFQEQYNKIMASRNIHIFVIEDQSSEYDARIVTSGTLLVEEKFLHDHGKVGHIEDIVVASDTRGQGYGKQMVDHLVKTAKTLGCYKVILNCKEEVVPFYQKSNFFTNGAEMRINLA